MGLMHQRADDNSNLPYPYSHGYTLSHRGISYRTIMNTYPNLLRFSNPRHLYPNRAGQPLGVSGDAPTPSEDGPADAARSLNNTAVAVANFRSSAGRCQYDLPPPHDVAAEGGTFTIAVATAATCAWDSRALDSGLSIAEGSAGVGNGQVVFTVEENPGWPRELALRIAGEVYAFRQDGSRLASSTCDSPTGHLTNLSTVPDNKELGAAGLTTHHVPLFLSGADELGRQSFVRVINTGEGAATVRVHPFDDTMRDYGSVTLTVAAAEAAHFNSHHLEVGGAGLSDGVGAGEGDWRLELETTEDVDVLAYVRHADGFLTSMHDVVPETAEGHVVPIFNPAGNVRQRSILRLVNPRGEDAQVTIRGIDDHGETRGTANLTVPAGRSRTISAQQLEAGHDAFEGALGDGEGKWRLVVRSDAEIQVMSLLEGIAGHLTNLSTVPPPVDRQ